MAGLNNTYNYTLTTLSPLSIGNEQEVVSSFSEYIYDNDYLYYIDLNKIENPDPEKIAAFIEKLNSEIDNNRHKGTLAELLKETLNIELEHLLTGEKYPIVRVAKETETKESQLVLKKLLKTRNRPYVSGSTLKGAIRAAILYHWLKNQGQPVLLEFIKKINEKYLQLNPKLAEIQKLELADRLNENEKNKLEKLKEEIRDFRNKIDKSFVGEVENLLFLKPEDGKNNTGNNAKDKTPAPSRHDASYLRVTDSQSVSEDTINIEYMQRVKVVDSAFDKKGIPFLLETVKKDTSFNFQIQIPSTQFRNNNIFHKELKFLQADNFPVTLKNIINEFSRDFIEEELMIFPNGGLKNDYEEIEKEIEKNDGAVLRIGFGKHFLNTSMALAIKKADLTCYHQLIKLLFEPDDLELHPATRTLTANNKTLGWVKLVFNNIKAASR
ncbi:type III-A CRISPR-associated RAMP protein Csm5 [Emticicia sp. 17c]|uniref:type III-A CRISPR-associated RAMP protein Csm5 n=1 Tax=Emticicia sp. 17c TaxID=3127704 RepID=UPI00301DA017